MKKNQFLKIGSLVIFGIGMGVISSPLSAANVFKNNNSFCQKIEVLCSSSQDPQKCADINNSPANSSLSLSCKDSTQGADFNGDSYPDCVAGVLKDTGFEQVSVLLNQGAELSDCNAANPKIFKDSQDYILKDLVGKNNFTNVITTLSPGSPKSEISLMAYKANENDVHFVSTLLSQNALGADGATLLTSDNQLNFNQPTLPLNHSNQSVISVECNAQDSEPMIVYVTKNSITHTFNLSYFQKDKPATITSIDTQVAFTSAQDLINESGYLAAADFNQDGRLDIVLGVNGSPLQNSPTNNVQLITFLQKNDCSFELKNSQMIAEAEANISSIKTGNFDEDSQKDVAVYLNKTRSQPFLLIFAGDNQGRFKNPAKKISPFKDFIIFAKGMTVGCFDNDDQTDIVISSQISSGATSILLLNSNDQYASFTRLGGGIDAPINPFIAAIESVNLDHTGGDDLLYLTRSGDGSSSVRVWMNEVEKATVSVGPDREVKVEEEIQLTGNCVGPDGELQVKKYHWSITPNNQVDLINEGTLTPTVKLHQEGVYKITLSCEYRCGEIKTASATLKTDHSASGQETNNPNDLIAEGSGGCSLGSLMGENQSELALVLSFLPGLFFSLIRSMKKNTK